MALACPIPDDHAQTNRQLDLRMHAIAFSGMVQMSDALSDRETTVLQRLEPFLRTARFRTNRRGGVGHLLPAGAEQGTDVALA